MKRIFISMLIACASWLAGVAQETYPVQLMTCENGYVMSDRMWASEGETVTLTLVPNPYYALNQLVVESEIKGEGFSDDEPWGPAMVPAYLTVPTTKVSENVYTFVMPASKVKVMADFAPVLMGDVDNNGEVNITDVTVLIDYLLTGNASGINLTAADCNKDGYVSIGDVTTLIDYLLNGSWE